MVYEFIDYSTVVDKPLYVTVDWCRPTTSWLAIRYHGKVCVKATKDNLLKYSLTKNGYSFQSRQFVGQWTNINFHNCDTFGLPHGILANSTVLSFF
jgi:hypothetical protein